MNPTVEQVLAQAQKQKATLLKRIETTKKCIELLETAAAIQMKAVEAKLSPAACSDALRDGGTAIAVMAIVQTQLLQLRAALEEGEPELALIESVIERASSPLAKASLVLSGSNLAPGRTR